MPKRIVFAGLIVLLLGVMVWRRDSSPAALPFVSTSALVGSIVDIGSSGTRRIMSVGFDAGEVSETLVSTALHIVLTPDSSTISHGAPLSSALTPGKYFGYKFTTPDAKAEKAAQARAMRGEQVTFAELFPGQFFASAQQRAADTFIGAFERDRGIIFAYPHHMKLERNARYIIVVNDAGMTITVRGLSWCGDGSMSVFEECDDGNGMDGDGCSVQCSVETGFTCIGAPSVCTHAACGDGTFATKTDYQVSSSPVSIALADISGDRVTDLVVLNMYNIVSTLLGNGDGTFAAKTDDQTLKHHDDFTLADLDGDGDMDTVTANPTKQTLSVYLRKPDGSMGDEMIVGQIGSGGPVHIANADLDNDGHQDIAVSSYDKYEIIILFGNGAGAFPTRRSYQSLDQGGDIAIADLDADGDMDIVTMAQDKILVFLGHGDRTFSARQDFPSAFFPSSIVIADLNRDRVPDLVTAHPRVDAFSIFLGHGDGTFAAHQEYASASFPSSVIAADLNGDGNPDVATVNKKSNTTSVFLGSGDGTFGEHQDYPTGLGPSFLASTDLNGDHAADLLSANFDAGTVSVLLGHVSGSCGSGN